jgi:hypothetical protein
MGADDGVVFYMNKESWDSLIRQNEGRRKMYEG